MATAAGHDARQPTAAELREYLLDQLNAALRRPGMFGGETALGLYLDAVGFAYGRHEAVQDEIAALRRAGAFLSTGVRGAFVVLWGVCSDDMISSVYVEVARRQGWLLPDRVVPEADYQELADAIPSWCAENRGLAETLARFGPAWWVYRHNPRWPATLTYVPESVAQPCLSFHFWNRFAQPAGGAGRLSEREYPEPMLLAVRRESDRFEDSLTFTRLGRRFRDEKREADRRAGIER
jgi:hypothetical protein